MRNASEEIEDRMNLNVRVPRELMDRFHRIAAAKDQSLSQEIRRLMREYIAEHEAA